MARSKNRTAKKNKGGNGSFFDRFTSKGNTKTYCCNTKESDRDRFGLANVIGKNKGKTCTPSITGQCNPFGFNQSFKFRCFNVADDKINEPRPEIEEGGDISKGQERCQYISGMGSKLVRTPLGIAKAVLTTPFSAIRKAFSSEKKSEPKSDKSSSVKKSQRDDDEDEDEDDEDKNPSMRSGLSGQQSGLSGQQSGLSGQQSGLSSQPSFARSPQMQPSFGQPSQMQQSLGQSSTRTPFSPMQPTIVSSSSSSPFSYPLSTSPATSITQPTITDIIRKLDTIDTHLTQIETKLAAKGGRSKTHSKHYNKRQKTKRFRF
jgi:hypothetical protein